MTALLFLTLAGVTPPAWQYSVEVDGQQFVTDKVVVLAARVAKPEKALPAAEATVATVVGGLLKRQVAVRVPFSKLQRGKAYLAPFGMQLGLSYVDYLAARLGEKALAFGFSAACQPVLVFSGGAVVGTLSPLATLGDLVGPTAEPTWSTGAQLADGRRVVLDNAFALVEALVAKTPDGKGLKLLSAKDAATLDGWLAARAAKPLRLADLQCAPTPDKYLTPDGLPLNPKYVDYLRARPEAKRFELHVTGDQSPVAVVLDGQAVAVLMPMSR